MDTEEGDDNPASNTPVEAKENFAKWMTTPEPYVNKRSASPTSTSYSKESAGRRSARPSTAQQEEVRWPQRNPHFRAISELGFFTSSVRRQARTAVPGSRLRVTTSAPTPEMEASMARVASPVESFYVEGEYTAHLHVTTEEEELTRGVGAKRVEYSRLHVQLLERMQSMQEVAHVYRKMCLEQDWQEYERLQAERKQKQEVLDGVFWDQTEAWRNSITLKLLLKRMVDLKREMLAMVGLMRDSKVKTEAQIVETNVKLAEANRAKQVSLEELDELKIKIEEEREHRKKELEFLRSGIDEIKESRLREVRRQEKHAQTLARMKSEEHQRKMERLRRLKATEEGGAEKTGKLEVVDESALAERILEETGVNDPNLFLVKMLTRDQTHNTLELQKARAHDAFERLNHTLETLILHKRELQLEGVDEAYQKRSTGDIESRLIKSEARLARAIRMYHKSVELIAPIRSGVDALGARSFPNSGRELDRRNSMSVNGSMLMGTWGAETPKPVTDESRQLEDTIYKLDTVGDKLVKLMESVDPGSVAYVEAVNSSRRSMRSFSSRQMTPRGSFGGSKARYTDAAFRRRSSEDSRSVAGSESTTGGELNQRGVAFGVERTPPRRSSDHMDRPPVPQRRSSDFRDDRGRPGEKGHRRRASDFATQSVTSSDDVPKRRSADSARQSRKTSEEAAARKVDEERRFEALLTSLEGADAAARAQVTSVEGADAATRAQVTSAEGADAAARARSATEAILEELVTAVSDGENESERFENVVGRRRPQSADEPRRSPEKEEHRGGVSAEEKAARAKSPSDPQVTIKEPTPFEMEPVKDAELSAVELGARRAMRRTMLQQNRAPGAMSVGIDERGTRKAILPGTRMQYPPVVEKVHMPRYNFRVGAQLADIANSRRQTRRRISYIPPEEREEREELDMAKQHAEFKAELERLSEEFSEEFAHVPARPRSEMRGRLNMLLSDGEEDELGFKRDFASVDLVALREKFSKAVEPRKNKSHKAFLKRMMNKVRSPERRRTHGMDNKLLGQLEIPGLGSVINNAVSPPAEARRKPLYEKKSELKGYNVITEKEQKRMLELLSDVRSKPKIRKAANRSKSPELGRPVKRV